MIPNHIIFTYHNFQTVNIIHNLFLSTYLDSMIRILYNKLKNKKSFHTKVNEFNSHTLTLNYFTEMSNVI
jgi:hypothetical protein